MCQAALRKILLGISLVAMLGACADLKAPSLDIALPEAFRAPLPADPAAPKADLQNWWHSFNDPMLNSIIDKAQANNLTLAQSTQRVMAARALVTPAESALWPQISASGSGSISRRLSGEGISGGGFGGSGATSPGATLSTLSVDKTSGTYQGGFDASWELPFFGRGTANLNAAKASLGAAQANETAARVSLLSEVARTYAELRAAQQKQLIVEKMLAAREKSAELTKQKRDAGLVDDAAYAQTETALGQTRAQLPVQQQLVGQKLQRLAVLCGQATPDAEWEKIAPLPTVPNVAFNAIPADLLRARPEVQAAEQTVLQKAANADLAAADLYPQLRLTGSLAASGTFIGQGFGGDSINLAGGPSISIPLIDWGSRQATVKARQAEWDEAALAYKETVLTAVEETENALNGANLSHVQAESLKSASDAAERAFKITDMRYTQGLTDQFERINVESTALQTALDSMDAQTNEITQLIALYKALGGAAPAEVQAADAN